MRASALGPLLAIATIAPVGRAADAGAAPSGGATTDAAPSRDAGARGSPTCTERVPEGKERPRVTESIAPRATSGHASWLEVVVEHGRAETVLPGGFRFQLASDEARALANAGFVLPDPDGAAAPKKTVEEGPERAKTTLRIAVVPLPSEPGPRDVVLPPLPIAVARASGDVTTLCTSPHTLRVDDPTANAPNAAPRANPAPRRQPEEWTTLKHAVQGGLAALAAAALVAFLVMRWRRRPKVLPPPPPPRPPWEVALEELAAVRAARLIELGRLDEHFDRVSDAVRLYLGGRYGFDGLESTTREVLATLERVVPRIPVLPEVESFLRHADLVKFARLTPTGQECSEALELGEAIVHRTMPELNRARPAAPRGRP